MAYHNNTSYFYFFNLALSTPSPDLKRKSSVTAGDDVMVTASPCKKTNDNKVIASSINNNYCLSPLIPVAQPITRQDFKNLQINKVAESLGDNGATVVYASVRTRELGMNHDSGFLKILNKGWSPVEIQNFPTLSGGYGQGGFKFVLLSADKPAYFSFTSSNKTMMMEVVWKYMKRLPPAESLPDIQRGCFSKDNEDLKAMEDEWYTQLITATAIINFFKILTVEECTKRGIQFPLIPSFPHSHIVRFNSEQLQKLPSDSVTKVHAIDLIAVANTKTFLVEEKINFSVEGGIVKFIGIDGVVLEEETMAGKIAASLAHHCCCSSDFQILPTDIQGTKTGKHWFDPALATKERKHFTNETNYGDQAIAKFFASHKCNEYCNAVQITDKKYVAPEKIVSIPFSRGFSSKC